MFRESVAIESVRPGDVVSFWNQASYRMGRVVESKKIPAGTVPIRQTCPGKADGPVKFVRMSNIRHVYRDVPLGEDDEDEEEGI